MPDRLSRLIAILIVLGAGPGLAQPEPTTGQAADLVTFSKDIAPILFERCSTCHRPGAIAPFSLLSYADARPWARAIKQATSTGSMPPWAPDPGYGGPFVGDRRLTEAEIDLIGRWVDAGALEGDPRDVPPPPTWTDGWRLGVPDLVIEMPEPYTLPADGQDVLRKFAIPIPTDEVRFVRGIEFQPGNSLVVHHANLRIDPTSASRDLDARDPEPGYDGVTPFDARFPRGYFLGWTPGQVRPLAAEGMAWRLEPGSDLLLELHLMPGRQPEVVQSRIGFFFSAEAPTRIPFTIRLGKQSLDIPSGVSDYVSRDRYVLPVDVEVFGVQPHAHYLARRVSGLATLPDGTRKWLIRISDWDFDWQDYYSYAEPFVLPKGTELAMEFTYDNSVGNPRNPSFPPRRVTFGQRSSNEMGDLWIQLLPRSQADLRILENNRRPQELSEDIVGFEMVLQEDPDQIMVHNDVALLYLQFGKLAEAATHFRESVRLEPASPAAHYNLGTTLLQLGALDEAVTRLEEALRLDPEYALAHNNLGAVLRSQGRVAEAVPHFREALRLRPDDAEAAYNLASALMLGGEIESAVLQYRHAIELDPSSFEPYVELAWILATDPTPTPSDTQQAIDLAERAAELTGRRDARVLDALAGAYAAAGRYERAVETARTALSLLTPQQTALSDVIRQRLELYTAGRAFRRPR